MVRKVSADELEAIKLMMRMMPELFWAPSNLWCGLSYSGQYDDFPQCSRFLKHVGPHVCALSERMADGSPPGLLTICTGTEPWYDEEN